MLLSTFSLSASLSALERSGPTPEVPVLRCLAELRKIGLLLSSSSLEASLQYRGYNGIQIVFFQRSLQKFLRHEKRDSPKIHPRIFLFKMRLVIEGGMLEMRLLSKYIFSYPKQLRKLNLYCIWLYSGFWQITLGTDTLYSRTGACVHVWKKKKKRRVLLAMYQPVAQGTSK